jgi:hypothetical protein
MVTCFPPFHLHVQTSGQSSATGEPKPTIKLERNSTRCHSIIQLTKTVVIVVVVDDVERENEYMFKQPWVPFAVIIVICS